MARTRVGVILSGCGVNDGSEIHEAVLTLLELARNGADAVAMAPDAPQTDVIDHAKGAPSPASEKRNMMVESARISRGAIQDIRHVRASDLDAVILPGGYGAAKSLCNFATAGVDCAVHPEVERLLLELHAAKKPIGAICIAPALVARVFGRKGIAVELTIGNDAETSGKLAAMGARPANRSVREICLDAENRIVSTPAYMLAQRIDEAADGIALLVEEVLKLAR